MALNMILFLPVDIDFTGFKFNQFDNSTRLTAFNPYWNSSLITEETIIKNEFQKILDQLPFTRITTLTHKLQQREVGEHIDVYPSMTFEQDELSHIIDNEPAGYRIVLKGAADKLQVYNGKEWVTAYTPSPCCYLLNSTTGLHRVLEDADREIIYVRGFLDKEKHRQLIEKSFDRYGQYAIQSLL